MTVKTFESSDGRITVRRISWAEFFRLRPDLRPANDNVVKREAA